MENRIKLIVVGLVILCFGIEAKPQSKVNKDVPLLENTFQFTFSDEYIDYMKVMLNPIIGKQPDFWNPVNGEMWAAKVFNVLMGALEILDCYKCRFQIEFLYRDGKQYTGLNDSQALSQNKLNFQFNAALTAINIAKVKHWLSVPKEHRGTFSMADIKTMNHNRLLLQRFIDVFGVNAYSAKNRKYVNELINYGTIAA